MKRSLLGGLLLAFSIHAHAASLVTLPRQLVVDGSGDPRSGALLYTYVSGTTTPLTSYTTPAVSVAHANPVVAVSTGLFPAIYFPDSVTSYKLVLKDSAGVTIWTEDNIPAAAFEAFPLTDNETSAGVTPTDFDFPEGHTARYGATCDGVADDTAEVQAAINVASENGSTATVQAGTCLVDTLTIDASNFTIEGEGRGSILKASSDIPASGAIIVSLAGGADEAVNQALLDGIYGADVVLVRTNVAGSLENVQIKNLTFEGNSAAVRGIWATGFTRGSQISGNYFNNLDGCGVCLNGSWSFSIIANHFEGDATNGTGIGLGQVGLGERGGSSVVNAANIIGNEVTGHANGMIWNFGAAGFIGGNTFEGNVTDGLHSQSVAGLTVVGNYFEGNGGDNLDMGGTSGTGCDVDSDCADGWIVMGNHFNNTSGGGNNIRLDGTIRSKVGHNSFSGTRTQHYFIATGIGALVLQNEFWVPDISSTYISNSSELDQTANIVVRSTGDTLFQPADMRHMGDGLAFFGSAVVAQQSDVGALTDSSGGTADGTVAAISGSGDDADINNNFAEMAAKLNALRTALRNYGLMP